MGFGDLPAQLFSPAKVVYIAYILAILFDKIQTSLLQFIVASVLFLIVEILHNDWLRILLNKWAIGDDTKQKQK